MTDEVFLGVIVASGRAGIAPSGEELSIVMFLVGGDGVFLTL